jgi:hypothetical protein
MMVRKRGDWLIAKVGDEHVMMSRQKVHHIGITEVGLGGSCRLLFY